MESFLSVSVTQIPEADVRLDQPRRLWAPIKRKSGVRRPRQWVGNGLVVTR